MDEIDSIGMSRENYAGSSRENLKTTSSLLKLIQEAKDNNIIIIAATNRRNLIDAALLNRFQSEIYFGLYDEKGIRENARRVHRAFAWNPGFKEYFAVKATPNPTILKILHDLTDQSILIKRVD